MAEENSQNTARAQIGVTGLAVMGANLARNLARHGYTVALHNRTTAKTDELLAEHGDEGDFVRTETLQELVDSLEKPRRILVMVKAGAPVDAVIEQLTPCWMRTTSSSTAATPTSRTPSAASRSAPRTGCTSSASGLRR
ncbi:6-phosphogluconate dehydrogenase, decarboxylating [Rothia kristinae]|nr:6-phosphogluconate dehydrogenase, decarboxylating [Rothia kristinae]